jgi:YfiR/HmsC-like
MRISFLMAFVFFAAFGVQGQQNYQTYTLYIHSFAKMIQWPEEDKKGDFEIYVLGESPIVAELQKMAERKKLGDRVIKVFKIASMREYKKGHMLFVPAAQSAQLNEVLTKVGEVSTLIITEQAGLGAKGSSINFFLKENKLAFELNQAALAKHKLKAPIELTRLATII